MTNKNNIAIIIITFVSVAAYLLFWAISASSKPLDQLQTVRQPSATTPTVLPESKSTSSQTTPTPTTSTAPTTTTQKATTSSSNTIIQKNREAEDDD